MTRNLPALTDEDVRDLADAGWVPSPVRRWCWRDGDGAGDDVPWWLALPRARADLAHRRRAAA